MGDEFCNLAIADGRHIVHPWHQGCHLW